MSNKRENINWKRVAPILHKESVPPKGYYISFYGLKINAEDVVSFRVRLDSIIHFPKKIASQMLCQTSMLPSKARDLGILEEISSLLKSLPSERHLILYYYHPDTFLEEHYYEIEEVCCESSNYNEDLDFLPATKESIEGLEKVEVKDCYLTNNACSICLDGFCTESKAMKMPCLHVFHGDCILEWLQVCHQCPICRYEMPYK